MKSRLWTDCQCLSGLAISETKTRHFCVLIRILVNWLYWNNFAHTKYTLTLLFYVLFADVMLPQEFNPLVYKNAFVIVNIFSVGF